MENVLEVRHCFKFAFGVDKYITGTDLQYLTTDPPKLGCSNLNPGLCTPHACDFLCLGFPFLTYKKTF